MTKEYNVNEVSVTGKVKAAMVKDHSTKNVDFYKFHVLVPRTSGGCDEVPVMVSSKYLTEMGVKIEEGKTVCVTGEYRSHKAENKDKDLFVFAEGITEFEAAEKEEEKSNNHIKLEGYVSRRGKLRTTGKGRKILDVIIAVNRINKASYIPCIIWNLSEESANEINIGNKICLTGRIQSREYQKRLEDETFEARTAYEVSVRNYAVKQ